MEQPQRQLRLLFSVMWSQKSGGGHSMMKKT